VGKAAAPVPNRSPFPIVQRWARRVRHAVIVAALLSDVVGQPRGTAASGSPHRRREAPWWELRCPEGDREGAHPECVLTVRLRGKMERHRLRQVQYALERRDEAMRTRGRDVAFHVDVDSEGGEMFAAMEIGRLLRTTKASISVGRGSHCVSACVFVLMGAPSRTVDVGARVGIHRPSLSDFEGPDLVSSMEESIRRYADEMTGSHRIVDEMMSIPSHRIHLLTPRDFAAYDIAVTITRPQRPTEPRRR
jgi:ATP-dependent protease ClpP protease subunit